MTRALFVTNRAARAGVEVEAIAFARTELDDRALRACAVAAVTFKTIAACQAALRLEQRFGFAEVLDDFIKAQMTLVDRQLLLLALGCKGAIPQVQFFVTRSVHGAAGVCKLSGADRHRCVVPRACRVRPQS